jgi:hypothetical protein
VSLARRAREDSARARAAVPAARQAEQAPAQQVRREVLLRHGDLASLPSCAELAQERQHDIGEHGARGVIGEEAVEGGMRSCVVELLERPAQLGGGCRDVRSLDAVRSARLARRLPRRLCRREAGREQLAHPPHPPDVVVRVEPIPALRALRGEQAVPALPRAQELGRHARATGELADPQLRGACHADSVQSLDRDLTRPTFMR